MTGHETIDLNTIGYRLRTEFGVEHCSLPGEIKRLLDLLEDEEKKTPRAIRPKPREVGH